jgi:hypothetical protein
MVIEQIVDSLKKEIVKFRRKQVRVNIDHRRGADRQLHLSPQFRCVSE